MWIEAMTQFRLIGSLNAVTVELTRRNTSHPNMPDVAGPMTRRIQINAPCRMRVVGILIEFQVNSRCVAAEQDKIDSVSGLARPPMGSAFPGRTSPSTKVCDSFCFVALSPIEPPCKP